MFRSGPLAEVPAVPSRDASDDFWFERRGKRTAAGVEVTVERARRVPVVRDCLQTLAQSVGGLSFAVFERHGNGDRESADGHPIKSLISDPNFRETSIQFLENLIDDLASEGRFLAERDFSTGEQTLWRIEPNDFTPELLPDKTLRFRIREAGRPERVLLHDEVWYIPLPPVIGKVHGRSPIMKDGVEAIGAALALQNYANTFFANDATPPVVFKHKGNFDSEASKANFLNAWSRFFGGRNRHKPGILEYGMDIQQLAHSNEQAQFLETRKELWLDIARLWRMPPHKVGILDNATFSNIEHQSLEFVVDTLAPWLELLERSINKFLIDDPRFYFEFNVASLLRGDIKTRYEAYALGRNWGFLSVNEIRRLENRNGIGPAGDRFMEPLNMAGVGGSPTDTKQDKEKANAAIAFLRKSVVTNGGRPNLKVVKNVA